MQAVTSAPGCYPRRWVGLGGSRRRSNQAGARRRKVRFLLPSRACLLLQYFQPPLHPALRDPLSLHRPYTCQTRLCLAHLLASQTPGMRFFRSNPADEKEARDTHQTSADLLRKRRPQLPETHVNGSAKGNAGRQSQFCFGTSPAIPLESNLAGDRKGIHSQKRSRSLSARMQSPVRCPYGPDPSSSRVREVLEMLLECRPLCGRTPA